MSHGTSHSLSLSAAGRELISISLGWHWESSMMSYLWRTLEWINEDVWRLPRTSLFSPEQFVEVVGGLHLLLPARPQLAADGGEAAEDAFDYDL